MLINSHTISSCKSLVTGTGGLKVEISCEYLKSHYERGFLHKVSFRPKNFRLKYMFSPNWKLHELICVPYINKSISKTKKSQLSLVSAFLSEERLRFLSVSKLLRFVFLWFRRIFSLRQKSDLL